MAFLAWSVLCAFGFAKIVTGTPRTDDKHTDKGFELRVTNSEGPVTRKCFNALGMDGTTPGTYFISGPAKFDGSPTADWKFQGIFDGFGMTNRFEIFPEDNPTKVCYTSVWMNTGFWRSFEDDPSEPPRGILFEDTIPARKQCFMNMCDFMAPNDNNWVNMLAVGNEALWLSDVVLMMVMDPVSMNFSGPKKWADDSKTITGQTQPKWTSVDHVASGGSAHPLFRPGTTTLVGIASEMPMVKVPTLTHFLLDLYTFDAAVTGPQNRVRFAQLEMDAPQYFHSFGVTPNYVVLPFNLQTLGLGPGSGEPFLVSKFAPSWRGIKVVDLKGHVHVFDDLDPFFHVHIVNCYENSSGIILDLTAFENIPFQRLSVMDIQVDLNKTARDTAQPRGQIRRIFLDLETKKSTVEKLTDNTKDYDFVKTNPSKSGLPYCIYYCVEWFHNGKDYGSMAVMKHNICDDTKTFWGEADVYLNEPFFIPSQNKHAAEDDGTIIITGNDGKLGKAIFVALDAKTMNELQRIELPNHIPFTAHGQFLPTTRQKPIVV